MKSSAALVLSLGLLFASSFALGEEDNRLSSSISAPIANTSLSEFTMKSSMAKNNLAALSPNSQLALNNNSGHNTSNHATNFRQSVFRGGAERHGGGYRS